MLHHFATLQRSEGGGGGDLTLTYMVSGVIEESGSDGHLQKVRNVLIIVVVIVVNVLYFLFYFILLHTFSCIHSTLDLTDF